jgi:MFS family permease
MAAGVFRTLRYRGFRLLFLGNIVSLVGSQIQFVALSWLVYRLTGSAAMLGLVSLISRSPSFFISPLAGVLADRTDRRKAFFVIQALAMLQSAALAVLVLCGWIQVWHLFVLGFFLGVVNAFEVPVRHALVYDLVEDKADLSNALALNTTMIYGSAFLGPLAAGPLIALIGEGPCFTINAVSFLVVLACVVAMPPAARQESHGKARRAALSGAGALREGFRYLAGHAPLRSLLVTLFLLSLMGFPYQVLMPVFAKEVLHGGPRQLGLLSAASGCGALAGCLYLASRRGFEGLERRLAFAATLFGVSLFGFSQARVPWVSMLFLAPAGMGLSMVVTGCQTLMQGLVEDQVRGRVLSFYTMAFMGTTPFGGAAYGFAAQRLGAPMTAMIGGLACAAVGATFWLRLPGWRAQARPILEAKASLAAASKA